jgi:hypothetical protein
MSYRADLIASIIQSLASNKDSEPVTKSGGGTGNRTPIVSLKDCSPSR